MPEFEIMTIDDVLAAIDDEKQLDPGLVSIEEKKRFVQDCLDDLGDLGVFEKVVEAEVSSSPVDLSTLGGTETGFEKVIDVYWNGRVLNSVTPRSVDHSIEANQPTGYWLVGNYLYLYPKLAPGASGRLMVEMVYRPLTVQDLPREWRRLLVLYGVARCFIKNGSAFSAASYMNEYETRKTSLYTKELQRRNQRKTVHRLDSFEDDIPYFTLRGL